MTSSRNTYLTSAFPRITKSALAALLLFSTSHAANVTWDGSESNDWDDALNWDTAPIEGDAAYINPGTVVYSTGTSVNLRRIHVLDGTMTLTGGQLNANFQSSHHSEVDATFIQSGGITDFNELEVGRGSSSTGLYELTGGEFIIGRGINDYSLYLGGNHDNNASGTGTFRVSAGSVSTRTGVKLGHATVAGTGNFEVIGSAAAYINIGSQGTSLDGWWQQHSGSTLKLAIDSGGVTKIFIDDVQAVNATHATFESGSLLDVSHYGSTAAGTWTVMEVENGDVVDNGLAFRPTVDAAIWSFNVDNTGANGLLTITSIGITVPSGNITWDGSEDSDYFNGLNWSNDYGPITAGDNAIINSGTVTLASGNTPNLNALRFLGGTMTVSGGHLKATASSGSDSRVDGTFYQTGGTVELNQLEIGRDSAANGAYYLSDGDMIIARGLNGHSIYLGGNHDNNASGTGTIEVTGGSLITRTGVKLGHATVAGTGTFAVLGTGASEIGIGSHNSIDGWWEQHAGSTLKVGIGASGVTKIFINDYNETNGTYATFENGSLLEVDHYNIPSGGGTWTVMEVQNGTITDNGLAFAVGVDTDVWSFNVDNSGTNGLLTVTATGVPYVDPNSIALTVGNTLNQQMRYGIDYERLWYWSGSASAKDLIAQQSVTDCDVDYVRVAISARYEISEGTYEEDAYFDADNQRGNDRIIPMMQDMKDANPDIKFFASPRPLDESTNSSVAWQPYPQWITGSTGSSSNFSFDEVKCSEYLLRYLLMMKHYGFKISYLDLTNEWNYITATDYRDISALFDDYLLAPWEHTAYPGVTLVADDIPQLVGASAWSYSQGRSWLSGAYSQLRKDAIDIVSSHNTDKGGTAQDVADKVEELWPGEGKEIWNTEVHGWKSTSSANEVLTYAFMMECINAGFSGLNGWLARGTTNQGHCYFIGTTPNVKYHMFKKLTNTSNRGYALDVNEPDEFEADSLDADASVSALIRGNLMTVWVLNHSDTAYPITINPTGRTISDFPIKSTRWREVDGTPENVEGDASSFAKASDTLAFTYVEPGSAYCFEILLDPVSMPYARIETESFDGSNPASHSTESCSDTDGGLNVSNINTGNWTRYNGINLDNADSIRLRVAANTGRPDGVIEIRTGSDTGTLIGSVAVPETGGWQNWCTIETPLEPTSGTHDVYLKYVIAGSNQDGSGSMFNLNWFEVQTDPAPVTQAPVNVTEAPVNGSSVTLNWDAVPDAIGYTVKRSTTQGGPYTVIDDTIVGTTYTDTSLSAGTSYYYVIVARYANSIVGDDSLEIEAIPSNPISPENINFGQMSLVTPGRGKTFNFSIMNSELGHTYQAQKREDLSIGSWLDVGNPKFGTGGILDFGISLSISETEYFFRVDITQQ